MHRMVESEGGRRIVSTADAGSPAAPASGATRPVASPAGGSAGALHQRIATELGVRVARNPPVICRADGYSVKTVRLNQATVKDGLWLFKKSMVFCLIPVSPARRRMGKVPQQLARAGRSDGPVSENTSLPLIHTCSIPCGSNRGCSKLLRSRTRARVEGYEISPHSRKYRTTVAQSKSIGRQPSHLSDGVLQAQQAALAHVLAQDFRIRPTSARVGKVILCHSP